MTNEEMYVVHLSPEERKFVKVYNDFLGTNLLSAEEKLIFIALKSFADYNKEEDSVYPSLKTLCKLSSLTRQKTIRAIKGLEEKGVIKKQRRGLTKTNIYVVSDHHGMWAAENLEELAQVSESDIPYSTETLIDELRKRGVVLEKEKGLTSTAAQSEDVSTTTFTTHTTQGCAVSCDNTTHSDNCKAERYSIDDIRTIFDYNALVSDNTLSTSDIDAVMAVLCDALNTDRETIRVSGENKPAMAVIGKLLKLGVFEIGYAIKKYNSVTDRIKNPTAYMLSILYSSKEQLALDVSNQYNHNNG